MEGVSAIFIFADQVEKNTKGYHLAKAIADVTGPSGLYGLQRLGGLWRIYAATQEAKDKLLINGFSFNRVHIPVIGTNPYVADPSVESVKLIIGNIPLSVSNSEIEQALKELDNVKIRSKLFEEKYRDDQGGLTSFRTGRRYVYIEKPSTPLPKFIQVMQWKASLYHFGQKSMMTSTDKGSPSNDSNISPEAKITEVTAGKEPNPTILPKQVTVTPTSTSEAATNQNSLDKYFRVPSAF